MPRKLLRAATVAAALLPAALLPAAAGATVFGDPSRNVSSDTPVGTQPTLQFDVAILPSNAAPVCAPEVAGGRVAVIKRANASAPAYLSVRSGATGAELWAAADPVALSDGRECPTADATRVVVAHGTQQLTAYDAADGDVLWTTPFPGRENLLAPVLADGRVYVSAYDADAGPNAWTLVALDAEDGGELWTSPTGSGPVLLAGSTVVTEAGPQLAGLNAATGATLWSATAPGTGDMLQVLTANGRVHTARGGTSGGTVGAIDGTSGTVLWSKSTSAKPKIVADAARLYVHTQGEEVRAYDGVAGTSVWDRLAFQPHGCLSRFGNQLLVSTTVVRPTTGNATNAPTGQPAWSCATPPVVADGRLYTVENGRLRARRDTTGPTVTTNPADGGAVKTRRPAIEWDVDDEEQGGVGVDTVTVTLDGTQIGTTAASTHHPASDLTEGTHTLAVDATDVNGNTTATTRTFTVDTTAPGTPVFAAPADGGYRTSPDVEVDVAATDAGGGATRVELRVDNVVATTLDGCEDGCTTTLTGLVEGARTISATAIDLAGNRGTAAARTVTIDRTGPTGHTLTSPDGSTIPTGEITFSWTAATDAGAGLARYDVYLDGAKLTSTTGLTTTATVGPGVHRWSVTAIDTLGNATSTPDVTFTAKVPQGMAPAGPACRQATPQRQLFGDGAVDSGYALDLRTMEVEVAADCTVTFTLGLDTNDVTSLDSLSVWVDTDGLDTTGSATLDGADRFLDVRGPATAFSSALAVIDPATEGLHSVVDPHPTAWTTGTQEVKVRTTVAALGLHPGTTAGFTFSTSVDLGDSTESDYSPNFSPDEHRLTVAFTDTPPAGPGDPGDPPKQDPPGPPAPPTPPTPPASPAAPPALTPLAPGLPSTPAPRPATKVAGTAKVGKTLTCAAPAGMAKPTFTWTRNGKAIKGAKRKTLKLRRGDAGKQVGCQARGTVAGKKVTVKSATKKVARR